MPSDKPAPLVSVIIVTWNSEAILPRCLDFLAEQVFRDFEVILVDNGSSDGCLEGIQSRYPDLRIQVEKLGENRGFGAANNIGARLAAGKWLALLNPDAFPEPGWMDELVKAADRNPTCSIFASRQVQSGNPTLLDGAGDAYHISGLAWRRYAGWHADRFGLEEETVFSACAAAALIFRQAFLQAGGFDEDFFMYHEDVDLGFRLCLLGHHCRYIPAAVVRHAGSASLGALSDTALYYWQRNFIWSFIQNMPARLLWRAVPAHLLANLIYQASFGMRGKGRLLLKGKLDAIRGLRGALYKRKLIQSSRKVSAKQLETVMEHGLLKPYPVGRRIPSGRD